MNAIICTAHCDREQQTILENCPFPRSPGSRDEEIERIILVGKLRARERKLKKRLRRADQSGDKTVKLNAIRAIECSHGIKVCAVIDACKRLPFEKRLPLAEIIEVAGTLNWRKRPDEEVRVYARPKKNQANFRSICKFRVRHRALQRAGRDVLIPHFCPRPFQFDCGHGGVNHGIAGAIAAIKNAILAGNIYSARLDIKAFYSSFDEEQLCKMFPLQKHVIRNIALGDHMNMVPMDDKYTHHYGKEDVLNQAHRGGPQGSSLSPKIGQYIISHLKLLDGVLLFNWVDDFLILGADKDMVAAAAKALIAQVGALPGGHFTLILKSLSEASSGIIFLGHLLTLHDGKVQVEPAYADDLYSRLNQYQARIQQSGLYGPDKQQFANRQELILRTLGDMLLLTKSWEKAFQLCDVSSDVNFIEGNLKQHACAAKIDWHAVTEYKNPSVRWTRRYS